MPVRLQNDGAAAAGEEQPVGAGVQGGQAVASARLLLGARGGGAGRGVGGAAGTCFVGQGIAAALARVREPLRAHVGLRPSLVPGLELGLW